jgi:hypothetical protein
MTLISEEIDIRDGKLSFQEFSDMVQSTDIVKYAQSRKVAFEISSLISVMTAGK